MSGNWTSARYGTAAAATSAPGSVPAYGMVNDLATAQWTSAEQFTQFARDIAAQQQAAVIASAEAATPGRLRDRELDIARNFESTGYAMTSDKFLTRNDNPNAFLGFTDDVQEGVHKAGNAITEAARQAAGSASTAAKLIPVVGGWLGGALGSDETPDDPYAEYTKAGGALTEKEFSSFSEETQRYLLTRAKGTKGLSAAGASALEVPGISQGLWLAETGYRGLTTAATMGSQFRSDTGWLGITGMNPKIIKNVDMWFDGSQWAQAWRDSDDRSLGNALVDNILSPVADEDQLDDWRKHNSLYQLSSWTAEIGAAWYADAGVIAGKGIGNAARVAKNQMPLNEGGQVYKGVAQNLRREQVTVATPLRKYTDWRAERIRDGQEGVNAHARAVDFADFARLPMFRNRDVDGIAAAKALHIAARADNPELLELTWQGFYGDPKAMATIGKMRNDPGELAKWGPGAQTFIDAEKATRRLANQLDQEITALKGSTDGSRFHRWEIDSDLAAKQNQLDEATAALGNYEDYGDWLELMGQKADPRVSEVRVPKRAWNRVEGRKNTGIDRFFMDNQFGTAHKVTSIPRAAWTKKAGTAAMHDLDSGVRTIERTFDQYNLVLGYADDAARAKALDDWAKAKTNHDRYKVLYDLEETHAVPALAQKLGVNEDVVRAIWSKVNEERNRTIRGIMTGNGRVYSSAPSLSQRLADEFDGNASLVSKSDDGNEVTIQLMDGKKKTTVTVPAEALTERVNPIDPTQTPNYYEPIDVRRLYLEMKRHEDVLETLNAGALRYGSAELAKVTDFLGTKFYQLWKPAQLFRFGWPQRVLMDEGLRAMAIYGPMYWLTGAGGEAAGKAISNVPAWIKTKYDIRRKGQIDLGAGGQTRQQKRSPNPFVRDQEVAAAVKIPASRFPAINPDRLAKITEHADLRETQSRTEVARAARGEEPVPFERGNHPLDVIRAKTPKRLTAYDPANGKELRSGFFVPIPNLAPGLKINATDPIAVRNLEFWYKSNAEVLSRRGIRLGVDPATGEMSVGQWFGTKQRGAANDLMADLSRSGVENPKTWDLSDGTTSQVERPDIFSPSVDAAYRHANGETPEGEALALSDDVVDLLGPSVVNNAFHTTLDAPKKRGKAYLIRGRDKRARRVIDLDGPIHPDDLPKGITPAGTWGEIFASVTDPDLKRDLVEFLKGRGVAALAHTSRGKQVHTWLTPESVSVRALHSGSDKFEPLQDWLYHPDSTEVPLMFGEMPARARARAEDPDVAYDLEDLDWQLDEPGSRLSRALLEKRKTGDRFQQIRTADGRMIAAPASFQGHEGELIRGLVSSDKTIDVLSEGHGGALSMLRHQAAGHKTIHPPTFTDDALRPGTKANRKAVHYFQSWADMVNNQIGNSPIWSKMLKGWSDEKIVAWLHQTPEGAVLRREMLDDAQSPELWVNEHRAKLDYYVPNEKVKRLLAKGRIAPSDLRKNIHNDDLPDIFGPDIELLRKPVVKRFVDGVWKSLGTVPIDALSRQPFAKAAYDAKMRSLVGSTDAKWLDGAMIETYQRISHKYALEQVRRTLFDLTDSTNMTDALRFVAPFWGAQQEAIVKWLSIISDRPETVARFFVGTRATYKNFVVIDEDGNEVERGAREGGLSDLGVYHPEDRVVLSIPSFMRHGPLGKALLTIGEVGVPMGSANTVLQGETPLFPGMGPLVTIPADKFLRAVSDTNGVTMSENAVYRWLFPIGRPSAGARGIMEQMLPGWGKRIMSASSSEDDVAKANLFMQVAREMYLEAQRKGEPMPSNEAVQKQANWLWGLRTVAGFVSPVQTEFRPKNQFFVDQAHKYRQEGGADWFDKFVEDFGKEAAVYAVSSSNSMTGVPPTNQGMEDWSQNKELIQKNPEWGAAIISPSAWEDDYAQDAYRAQFETSLGAGDNRKLRELNSPQARLDQADQRLGWLEFRKFDAGVNAELAARGLTSIQQNGAEDLVQVKAQFIAQLTHQYPAWRDEYGNIERDIYPRVNQLASFAFNPEFDKRPDMLGVRQYLVLREQVTSELDRYFVEQGGSRSLQAQENAPLRQWFYTQVGQIVMDNPSFAEFYSRWLDADKLDQGSGGFDNGG